MTAPAHEAALRDRTVGDIATSLPGATAVLRRFRISFCCNGDLTLAEAAARRGVDTAELEHAIQSIRPTDAAAAPADMANDQLIGHIVERYHGAHRQMLPELIALSTKVESVHRHNPNAPAGLADALQQLESQLTGHMKEEEEALFPAMQGGNGATVQESIAQLRQEHDRQAALLERIEGITDSFRLPEGACRSWQALYMGGSRLADDVIEHIHLENNVLFPRFASSTETAPR